MTTYRAFVDMNDRDREGRIRIGASTSIVDDQDNPIPAQEGLEVVAYDNSMTVPGVLRRADDRWIIEARWDLAEHDD